MTVVLADPAPAIVDYLVDVLSGRAEPFLAGVDVGVWYPTSSTPETPALPFVQVATDGTPGMDWPVTARATVRLTVWHRNPGPAAQAAALILGLLAEHPGDDRVWAVQPLTGPLAAVDPNGGAHLSSLTVRVSVRPAEV